MTEKLEISALPRRHEDHEEKQKETCGGFSCY